MKHPPLAKSPQKGVNETSAESSDDNIFDITTPMKSFKDAPKKSLNDVQQPSKKRKRDEGGQTDNAKLQDAEVSDIKILGVESLDQGPKRHIDDQGYAYYEHSRTAFRRQLKCVLNNVLKYKCPARASAALDPPDSPIILSSKCAGHNHLSENDQTRASTFAKRLKERVIAEPNVSLREIFEEEKVKFPECSDALPENVALNRMRRYRRIHNLSIHGIPEPTELLSDDEDPGPSSEIDMSKEGRVVYVDSKGYQYHQQHVSMNKRSSQVTESQISTLVNFMEERPFFMNGELLNEPEARVLHDSLWRKLTNQLNSTEGASKTISQWQKFWAAHSLKTKRRDNFLSHKPTNSESHEAVTITRVSTTAQQGATDQQSDINRASTSVDRSDCFKDVTGKQKEALVVFMEMISRLKRVDPKIINVEEEWVDVVDSLNSCGPSKTVAKWKQVWSQMETLAVMNLTKANSTSTIDNLESRIIKCVHAPAIQFDEADEYSRCLNEISLNATRITEAQKCLLINFMEKHYEVLNYCGTLRCHSNRFLFRDIWTQITNKLNSLKGPSRTAQKWQRTWTDLKIGVLKKNKILKSYAGSSSPTMTPMDLQILSLIERFGTKKLPISHEKTNEQRQETKEIKPPEKTAKKSTCSSNTPLSVSRLALKERVTPLQKSKMVEFVEENPEMANAREEKLSAVEPHWEQLAVIMNSMEGPNKTVKKWRKSWFDMKYTVLRKMLDKIHLTPVEERIWALSDNYEQFEVRKELEKMVDDYIEDDLGELEVEKSESLQLKHQITPEQKDVMVQFIEEHPELIEFGMKVRVSSNCDLWEELTTILNFDIGPSKSTEAWQTIWVDMKSSVLHKARALEVFAQRSTNWTGPSPSPLSPTEEKIAELMYEIVAAEPRKPSKSKESEVGSMCCRITEEQKTLLVEYLKENPVGYRRPTKGGVAYTAYHNAWVELTKQLNAIGGVTKEVTKWQKCWSELKLSVKRKVKAQQAGDSSIELMMTSTEMMIASLIAKHTGSSNIRDALAKDNIVDTIPEDTVGGNGVDFGKTVGFIGMNDEDMQEI